MSHIREGRRQLIFRVMVLGRMRAMQGPVDPNLGRKVANNSKILAHDGNQILISNHGRSN